MVKPSPAMPKKNSARLSQNGLLWRSTESERSRAIAMMPVRIGTGAARYISGAVSQRSAYSGFRNTL